MFLLSPAAPKARDGRYCNAPRPSVCPSVRLSVRVSVMFSFRTVTQKRIDVFSRSFAVFDIDGMLFEFFMNFLNIEKKKFLRFFFSIFHVFFAFHAISNIKKKIGVKKKTILSHFTFYAIVNIKKNIKKHPFTYWLNGRWFLQIVETDSWNLYPLYPLFPCSDFVSQMWGWFGGGGV